MAYKMTEEFASAMVTVIPIILVASALEISAIAKTSRDNGRRRREATLAAIRAGSPEPPAPSALARRAGKVIFLGWYVSGLIHILAEMSLIRWLAGTERAANPAMAQMVFSVATAGFAWVLGAGIFTLFVTGHLSKAENRRWKAECARERAIRASAVPVVTTSGPGQGGQP
ncbi:hypothetical protein ACGFOU_36015 [Streptomyces sp. NPDC048595]|uniref:hypothetical protein n=1 Tax=Streptomyces sp. NPDC048595 TaxID=3365576 RepID=UPI00371F3C90